MRAAEGDAMGFEEGYMMGFARLAKAFF